MKKYVRDSKGRFSKPPILIPTVFGNLPSGGGSCSGYYPSTWWKVDVAPRATSNILQKSAKFLEETSFKKVGDLTFFKVLSVISVVTSSIVAFLYTWEYTSIIDHFEYLKWLLFGHHPGLH